MSNALKYEDTLREHIAENLTLVRNSASRFLLLDFLLKEQICPHFKQIPIRLCGAQSYLRL